MGHFEQCLNSSLIVLLHHDFLPHHCLDHRVVPVLECLGGQAQLLKLSFTIACCVAKKLVEELAYRLVALLLLTGEHLGVAKARDRF